LNNHIKQAVIVAAGLGSRLKPYSDDHPKSMIEVNGTSMIRANIQSMLQEGIENIIVVVGYQKEVLGEHLQDYPVKLVHNPFYAITNNMASLWFAAPFLDGDFISSHSDLVFDPSLMKIIVESSYETALLVEEKLCGDEEMKVVANEHLLVESSKLLDPTKCIGEWTGIAKFSHKFTQTLMARIGSLLEEDHLMSYDTYALTQLAQRGESVRIITFQGVPWMEIDTPEDLAAVKDIFGLISP